MLTKKAKNKFIKTAQLANCKIKTHVNFLKVGSIWLKYTKTYIVQLETR